jgi:prepilin-type N-terminal cleavage/methylation domain-containing protein
MRKRGLQVASGFTLLEVLVALTVLAVGAAVSMSLLSGALGNIRRVQQRTKLIGHAESVMQEALLDDTILSPTTLSGDFDDGTRWTVNVEEYVPEISEAMQSSNLPQNIQFQLLQYTVDVESSDSSVANYSLQTLKLTKVQN